MAEKFLKFSVVENIGKTFEIPMKEVHELLKNSGENVDNWDEIDMAEYLYNNENISPYEKDKVYYETNIQDEEIC